MSMNVNGSDMSGMYGAIFGTSSSNSSNNILGDYALIKSGVYKKMLKAYYAKEEKEETGGKTEAAKDPTASLLTVKSNASSLSETVGKLGDKSLYQSTGKDDQGNTTYNRDKIKTSVKDMVDKYNSYVSSAGSLDSSSILSKTLNMTKIASSNKNLLSDAGITIGSDNKLTVDEKKLDSADMSTLTSLFTGKGSFGDQVKTIANQSYKIANSTAYNNNKASSYTYDGTYSLLGTTNGVMDQFL